MNISQKIDLLGVCSDTSSRSSESRTREGEDSRQWAGRSEKIGAENGAGGSQAEKQRIHWGICDMQKEGEKRSRSQSLKFFPTESEKDQEAKLVKMRRNEMTEGDFMWDYEKVLGNTEWGDRIDTKDTGNRRMGGLMRQ